jgi:hypothetical protein
VPHLARYSRAGTRVIWQLDDLCFADYARVLLRETGRYTTDALQWLFRGALGIQLVGGGAQVTARAVALGAGTLSVYADVTDHPRQLVRSFRVSGAADGDLVGDVAIPAGAQRLAAVFRGVDDVGEPLVIVQEATVR